MEQLLKSVFEPRSVAVIGASEVVGSVGRSIFSNIIQSGFNGVVYPVNPKYRDILSVRAYASVTEIPDTVDLAIICIPAKAVEDVLVQCAEKNVKGVVLITAGFKEIGEEGKLLENQIIETAKKHNISLIGPNCLGVVNTNNTVNLNANFAFNMPKPGNIALISQSGAIGIVAIDYAHQHDLGISKFASIGNKAVIDESDVLEYLIEDEGTKVITMYIEDIGRPERFSEMAKKAAIKQKPIIVIKTGTSTRGAIAAHSHTGALSSSDVAYDSLFAQCGVIRVASLDEVFECAKGFTCMKQPKGNRIAVLTNAGGMGIITTDSAEKNHLEMATLEPSTLSCLKKVLPPTASVNNPVDVIGDADAQRFDTALSFLVKDKNVDAIIVCVTPTVKTDMEAIAQVLCNYAKSNPDLPILTNLISFEPEPSFISILEKENIPNFDFPEVNVRVLAAMIKYYKWIKQPQEKATKFKVSSNTVEQLLNNIRKEKRNRFTEPESYSLLDAYGMKSVRYSLVKNLDEALSVANKIGYPVVLKIVSPDIMHKTDIGGVKINLKNESELKQAYQEIAESVKHKMPDARIDGYVVEEFFTTKGIEIIAGVQAVKGFGHLIMFGLGGTFVELFKDVSFRLAPLTKLDAINMIQETKGYQILKGYRGQASYDIEAIADYLLRISQLVTDFPAIKELDMNPIRVLEDNKGVIVMDAKIVVEDQVILTLAPTPEKVSADIL